MAVAKIPLSAVAQALGLAESATEEDVLHTAQQLRDAAPAPDDSAGSLRIARQALTNISVQLFQRRERSRDPRQAFADMTDLAQQAQAVAEGLPND